MWWTLLMVGCLGIGEPPEEVFEAPAPVEVPPEPPEEAGLSTEVAPLVPPEPRYAVTHVVLAWQGAVRAPPDVTRTEEEAHALAESVRQRALAGEALETLARELSDGPSGPRGGGLGATLTGTMVPEFELAVASVEPGEIGPLVRTPFGWHVVRRDPVVQVEASQVVVAWQGAVRSQASRSREEARARIEEAAARLAAGTPFAEVARVYSDGPEAAEGGRLGVLAPGQVVPAFEEVVFALDPGETSGVVETPYGFHLVHRH